MRIKPLLTFLLIFVLIFSMGIDVTARMKYDINGGDSSKDPWGGSSAAGPPAHCTAGHRIGQIVLGINNNGTFGSGFRAGSGQDCFTGEGVPSCEYPKASNVEYLFAAAFWIGAVVGRDTLVSFGADGWNQGREMFPDESPFGDMKKRSIIDPNKPELYEDAVSEEDFVSTYSDTYTQGIANDVISGRPHRPLNIKVSQSSYAWSYSYAEDIVLFDYQITNIGYQKLDSAYMGIYVDADVCYDCANTNGFADDICGFVHTIPAGCDVCEYTDTVNIAWIADNDGDFSALYPAPHVTATRIVRTPAEDLDVSFNWWISNGNASLDFGPRERSGVGRLEEDFRDFGGYLGTPEGDANKYYIMRNQEFDYDQVFTHSILPSDTLWLYPDQSQSGQFSRGYDTRYLLSFGPFDINPGDVLPISFAYMAGANLHTDRNNRSNLPDNPERYYKNLDFTDLGDNSRWASWIYDNPGVDSDSNGYFGEVFVCVSDSVVADSSLVDTSWTYTYVATDSTVCFVSGDGIPDFRGASPPPAPLKWVVPTEGTLQVTFNGFRSETTIDAFSGLKDFEGYRVYIARDDQSSSFSLIASYDVDNYNKWVYDDEKTGGAGYSLNDPPYTRDSLQCAYGVHCDSAEFIPSLHGRNNPYSPPGFPDSSMYFVAQDYNASEFGVNTKIEKVYPYQPYPSTLAKEFADPDELTDKGEFKYFEYMVDIEDLLPTVPFWVNVTAFDFGSPQKGLKSLETSVTHGSLISYPLPSSEEVATDNLPIYVYPNPYRLDAEYLKSNYEGNHPSNFTGVLGAEYQREIHFANLPPKCTIKIFSLDGDMVKEINHDIPASSALSSHNIWNLITRNNQQVVSGIYYWTVETDDKETQIGKLVIIM